ncbi:MAG: endo alpha-1,4 polygalactosaminidase [Balneola sp.]|nr:endo alpha-1,4 polygalactosaminidase [Balneola sp.]MBO6651180.1 endo alpha-1,4 polygalactosaminidase [Balneola sp.]MBO6710369.1 endo alpha-1,4 polygalactosaminidase [Balneola sp.]MBO6799054.1 endo alpha-1,4 polygalactosaminidase [Balneola sp.]MBO6870168.1 endo alpha-1,4 polygalactosaminidase [Balneola sp.]
MHNKLPLIIIYLLTVNCISSSNKLSEGSTYDSFGVVYSDINSTLASGYKLLIVEPYFYSKQDINDFHSRGIKVVAYLSLGEVNESRRYFNDFKEIGLIGKNENHGSYFTNLSDNRIKDKFINEIVPELLSYGYDGLFLDTIDAVAPYTLRRSMEQDMVELISGIRSRNPDKLLIQNAGFFLLDKTAAYVDAVTIEAVASGYDFNKNEYQIKSKKQYEERLDLIDSLHTSYGIPFLIIDFAENYENSLQIKSRLEDSGFPYFINNIEFRGLPNFKGQSSKLKKGA